MSPSTIETLVLHSVVRVLLFRKRPSETNSGPGLKTPTDAVTVVRLQLYIRSALVQCSTRSSVGVFCYKYFSTCLTQRILCESPFASFPVSCLPASPASFATPRQRLPSRRQRQQQRNTDPTLVNATRNCLVVRLQQRRTEGQPILRIKQTKYAAAATCSKYVADPWTCRCSCNSNARQTAGRNVSNESTSLQDTQQGSKGLSKLHWLI
jgi:hypothetical protein